MELNKIYNGDSLEVLKTLPDESVDMCVTSPPYWGLRDYGVEGQLGLEGDFHEYIDKLCTVFDEVRRVLKDSGTLWVNISDTYSSPVKGSGGTGEKSYKHQQSALKEGQHFKPIKLNQNTPTKSLVGIPEEFVLEMRNRGWIRRNTLIWHKPNCMPSSVKDRFTVDFEYLYFFSKQQKYFFEQQFEEFLSGNAPRPFGGTNKGVDNYKNPTYSGRIYDNSHLKGRNMRCVWHVTTKPYKGAHFAVFPEDLIETPIKAGCPPKGVVLDPFIGSGTTAAVAKKLNRNYVGIELNPDYLELINNRLESIQTVLG